MKQLFIFSLSLCLVNYSCYKKCAFSTYDVPFSLFFIVKENGSRISDNLLNQVKLYYYKDSNKIIIPDFIRGTEEGFDLGVLTSREIGFISGEDNIKNYFIDYNNGDIDTLYIDYKSLSQEDACNHPCRCCCPLELVKFNGKIAALDSTIKVQKVYVFNK
jgi:hypothetical protein